MDSTSSTAIAGTFLLAEAGALLYAQMLTTKLDRDVQYLKLKNTSRNGHLNNLALLLTE